MRGNFYVVYAVWYPEVFFVVHVSPVVHSPIHSFFLSICLLLCVLVMMSDAYGVAQNMWWMVEPANAGADSEPVGWQWRCFCSCCCCCCHRRPCQTLLLLLWGAAALTVERFSTKSMHWRFIMDKPVTFFFKEIFFSDSCCFTYFWNTGVKLPVTFSCLAF